MLIARHAQEHRDPGAAATDNLRVQISQLRKRIEQDPRHPALIVTEPGLGYRFFDGAAEPAAPA